ncbi:MAG: DNA-3-methyladenine glycosylase [Polyangiaceae bacterium]
MSRSLRKKFYSERTTLDLARDLLGCEIVHVSEEGEAAGIIVETEGYLSDDPGSHAFRRKTERNAAMFGPPGTLYIYQIYNHYHCINVVSGREGIGEAVLIRAIEPTRGIELMEARRNAAFKVGFARYRSNTLDASSSAGLRSLANGPAKLTIALGLRLSEHNGASLTSNELYVRAPARQTTFRIVQTTRVGLTRGADLPYRFYVERSPFVSKR